MIQLPKKLDPFIIPGSKVLEGVGTFLVTSVGENSSYGKIMLSLQIGIQKNTPLQGQTGSPRGLDRSSRLSVSDFHSLSIMCVLMLIWGLMLLLSSSSFSLIRFLANISGNLASPGRQGPRIPRYSYCRSHHHHCSGYPKVYLGRYPLALAFATTRMLKENNLVRVLRACELWGTPLLSCSDKTGTLTLNKMDRCCC